MGSNKIEARHEQAAERVRGELADANTAPDPYVDPHDGSVELAARRIIAQALADAEAALLADRDRWKAKYVEAVSVIREASDRANHARFLEMSAGVRDALRVIGDMYGKIAKACYPFSTATCNDPRCTCRDEKRAAGDEQHGA